MKTIFSETFALSREGVPGAWDLEHDSGMNVSAVKCYDDRFEILSGGNKFLPVIPDIFDFELKAKFAVNCTMAGTFRILLSFRYDAKSRTGQTLRIFAADDGIHYECGTSLRNRFTMREYRIVPVDASLLDTPFNISLKASGNSLEAKVGDACAEFTVDEGCGKIALSREHFLDTLQVLAFDIATPDALKPLSERSFRVELPTDRTFNPIHCDVTLRDWGDCMDAALSLSGGVTETPVGEGNYHVMRYDWIVDPYLSVITADDADRIRFHKGEIVRCHKELVRSYFWAKIHQKTDWPFNVSVRFVKPAGAFDLAIGSEFYRHNAHPAPDYMPAETRFDLKGHVIASGTGYRRGVVQADFASQPDKAMLARLPPAADDPRRELAEKYVRDNHYFQENEDAVFTICASGFRGEVPVAFKATLADAFLRPVRDLAISVKRSSLRHGVTECDLAEVKVEPFRMKPGVYHLRLESADKAAAAFSDYCALEFMPAAADSAPAPILSGLPYLYNSRTETRGLETDGFDPWSGKSIDEGHYMACANFQPKATRDFNVSPTVHAYGRESFLWLGTRNADQYLLKDNMDIVAGADYVNFRDEFVDHSMLWRAHYHGWTLKLFCEFAKRLADDAFDYKIIDGILESCDFNRQIDNHNLVVMFRNHWEEWMDYVNDTWRDKLHEIITELRRTRPNIRYSGYGPAHIYAAHLKGPEFTRFLRHGHILPEDTGFMQFEDYPYSCAYPIERGQFFLTGCLMAMRGIRIFPEIYTVGGFQGCPDGAVYYAHPPFGKRDTFLGVEQEIARQAYEFACASAYLQSDGFHYWSDRGFQACHFSRPWFEALLRAWGDIRDHEPAIPLRSAAFAYSDASRRAWKRRLRPADPVGSTLENARVIDVQNSASEDVPYAYETARVRGLCAGFQMDLADIAALKPEMTDLLVIPPLKGMPEAQVAAIRRLHEAGVSLLAFEDVTGLEDLFGVRDTGAETSVRELRGTPGFLENGSEVCNNPLCAGRHVADGADVLVRAEIPVLFWKDNGQAKAALFNVAPAMVREDELDDRLGYGQDGISTFMAEATAEVMRRLSRPAVSATGGSLIAYKARGGESVVIVQNMDERKPLTSVVAIEKAPERTALCSCSQPHTVVEANDTVMQIKLRIAPGASAFCVLG
ncbi:MAG: hypothetical protein PHR35_15465 [Kiritimatiellae bacterium]|nr:hypothetical protein [Kiritimatiellia bacterium]